MITDYTSLQATIADYLGRSDLATQIQSFIANAEASIYRSLRVRDMLETTTLSLTIGEQTVARPADHMETLSMYLTSAGAQVPLLRMADGWIEGQFPSGSATGVPRYYGVSGNNIIFGPAPSTAMSVSMTYYGRLVPLSATNPTNWLTGINYDLIMAAAMLEGATYLQDDQGVAYWTQRYQHVVQSVQDADLRDRYNRAPQRMRNPGQPELTESAPQARQ